MRARALGPQGPGPQGPGARGPRDPGPRDPGPRGPGPRGLGAFGAPGPLLSYPGAPALIPTPARPLGYSIEYSPIPLNAFCTALDEDSENRGLEAQILHFGSILQKTSKKRLCAQKVKIVQIFCWQTRVDERELQGRPAGHAGRPAIKAGRPANQQGRPAF